MKEIGLFRGMVTTDIRKLKTRISNIELSLSLLSDQNSVYAKEHEWLLKCHKAALNIYSQELLNWNKLFN